MSGAEAREAPRLVREAFERIAARHYRLVPSAPLSTDDPTLLFTNASVTPYKARMLRGEPVEGIAVVQNCLRTAPETMERGWMFYFRMLGIVGPADLLRTMTSDLIELVDGLDFARGGRIHCALDRDHEPLAAAVDGLLPPAQLFLMKGNVDKLWTEWRFGHGDELTGRGLTLLWEDVARAPCSPACDMHCWCSKYQMLGNVIELHHHPSGTRYAETGFGLESIAAITSGRDMFRVGGNGDALDALIPLVGDATARAVLSGVIGCTALVDAGFAPAGRKHGHVLRRMVRRLDDLVLGDALAADQIDPAAVVARIAELVEACRPANRPLFPEPSISRAAEIIAAETGRFAAGLGRGVRDARRLAQRRTDLGADSLVQAIRQSYGLPAALAHRVVREASAARSDAGHGTPDRAT